jgi:peptide/nickel transport system permease protein
MDNTKEADPMYAFIVRRIFISIPLLILISMILFTLIQLAPGDAFTGDLDPRRDANYYQEMRAKFGLDKSPVEQYVLWAKNFLQGEFGVSFRHKTEVSTMIAERIGNTFFLAVSAMIITYAFAIPIGILQAERPYSKLDYTVTAFSFIGLSLPSFIAGVLAVYLFSFTWDWFPYSGTVTPGASYTGIRVLLDKLYHVILPATTLAILQIVQYTRYVRASILDVKQQDYVRTAYAKGLPKAMVLRKVILRNSLIPLITLFGIDLGLLFSGAIITETIFSWPGIGWLLYDAILNRDYPIIMAVNMMVTTCVLLGNLIADVLYTVADPRISYD